MDNNRVLLIEDNPGDVLLIEELLNEAQKETDGRRFVLLHGSSLSDGLAVLQESEVQAVLLDLSLPGSRGEDTFLQLHEIYPNLPVVVLTGLDDEAVAVKTLQSGAQDYLVKGCVSGDVLLRSLRYAIERQRLLNELEQKTLNLQISEAQQTRLNEDLDRRVRERTLELSEEMLVRQQAEQALRRYADRLEALEQVSQALRTADTRRKMFSILVEMSASALQADGAWLFLVDNKQLLPVEQLVQDQSLVSLPPAAEEVLWQCLKGESCYVAGLGQSLQQSPALMALLPVVEMKTVAIASLHTGEIPIGLLLLGFVHAEEFSQDDLQLLTAVAEVGGISLHRAEIMEKLVNHMVHREQELTVLYEITALSNELRDQQTLLLRSLQLVMSAVESVNGTIHLVDEDGQNLTLSAQEGLTAAVSACYTNIPLHNGENESRNLDLHACSDIMTERWPDHQKHCLGAPIRIKGQPMGLLSVFKDQSQDFTIEEAALLNAIGDQLGLAIESIRLQRKAEQAAVMEERQRLTRELHDSVTQSLYGLVLFARAGQEAQKIADEQRLSTALQRVGTAGLQALKEMRLLLYELRPMILEQEGLVQALSLRLDAVERRAGIEASLQLQGSPELPKMVEGEIYRIVIEALNNTLKHAAALNTEVKFTVEEGWLLVEVNDDGVGFDPQTVTGGGMGLKTMSERAQQIGAKLQIDSAPQLGTHILLQVPLMDG